MNAFELATYAAALICLGVYFGRKRIGTAPGTYATLLLIVAVVLYFSVLKTTQFLTVDEQYMILDAASRDGLHLRSWREGALRTSLALMALPNLAFRHLLLPDAAFTAAIKAAHWLSGLAAMIWLHDACDRHWMAQPARQSFFLLFFTVLLGLPGLQLGLKIFNYDALALILLLIAVVYMVVAARSDMSTIAERQRCAAGAVIAAALGAQEKLSTSPFLLVAIAVFVAAHASAESGPRSRLWHGLRGLALALAVFLASAAVVAAGAAPGQGSVLDRSLIEPLSSWAWPILYFSFGAVDYKSYAAVITVLSIALILSAATLAPTIFQWMARWAVRARACLLLTGAVLLVAIPAAGIVGAFDVLLHWAPASPIAPGHYDPGVSVNRFVWHFGALTLAGHLIRYLQFACAIFLVHTPTVIWIAAIAALVLAWRSGRTAKLPAAPLIILGLLFPIPFALGQIPVNWRYLAPGIALLALGAVATLCNAIALWRGPRAAIGVALALGTGLALEMAPFRPLFFAFRPIWMPAPADIAQPGVLSPVWPGWGEELMLAGELVAGHVKAPATIYSVYSASWLSPPPGIRAAVYDRSHPPRLGDHDYVILNRTAVAAGRMSKPSIAPDFELAYRGYVQAWVYRGDRLVRATQ